MDKAPSPDEITRILRDWQSGNKDALDRLVPVVYDELRILASRQLAGEWRHNRLDTTAVVNEAYLKLFGQREVDWQNRGHFFAIAAQLMRRILVDHARRHLRDKHGGAAIHVALREADAAANPATVDALDALALDRARAVTFAVGGQILFLARLTPRVDTRLRRSLFSSEDNRARNKI